MRDDDVAGTTLLICSISPRVSAVLSATPESPPCSLMLAAFLTTIFFSLSSIAANRAIRAVGGTRANLGRMVVATSFLALWAHLVPLITGGALGGRGVAGAGVVFFFISGVLGMGLGDIAVFAALPLLGARLTVVMTQCLAAPIAALAEWLWLGTTLRKDQIGWSIVVLAGVAIALLPSRANPPRVPVKWAGILFGFLSAVGQGLGAVLSRKGYDLTHAAGQTIDGMTATYQRILGGFAISVLYFAVRHVWIRRQAQRLNGSEAPPPRDAHPRATALPEDKSPFRAFFLRWRWTLANGLSGAVIGVSCYQWALSTTASGIVLPIVATTPIVVVPLAYWLDGDRPTRRSLIGGVIAVIGAVLLARSK